MFSNYILFGEYNSHLISRLHSRSIFEEISQHIDRNKIIVLDFENVSVVTLSFATELIDNLKKNKIQSVIKNANQFVKETLDFAIYSSESKEFQV